MTDSVFRNLPVEWQDWINGNLDRGCDPQDMARMMGSDSHFTPALTAAAIREAVQLRTPLHVLGAPRPTIETSCNVIHLPDRDVEILLSVATPRIVLLGNVLSDAECDALAALSNPRFVRSAVLDNADGRHQFMDGRTSESASIARDETELVSRVDARLAALTGWPVQHGEPLQLQKYAPGKEYRPHFDWFDAQHPGLQASLAQAGQRLGTVILYLTDVEAGGGTAFPAIGLTVHPKKGSALFFSNVDTAGEPDKSTLHAGLPVERGLKIVANKWLRERAY